MENNSRRKLNWDTHKHTLQNREKKPKHVFYTLEWLDNVEWKQKRWQLKKTLTHTL